MAINISDYKKVYNVAECAGITNFDMTDMDNCLDVYNKIIDWVNEDNELSKFFTAELAKTSAYYDYYSARLTTSTGLCINYGCPGTNYFDNIYSSVYTNGGIYSTNKRTAFKECAVNNLYFTLVKGAAGFIFGFYSSTSPYETQIHSLVTTCINDVENNVDLGILIDNGKLDTVTNSMTNISADNFMSNCSTSSKTSLSSFLVPNTNLLSENCRLVDGHQFTGLTFFEAGGKKWCMLSPNTSYKGLAMLLED